MSLHSLRVSTVQCVIKGLFLNGIHKIKMSYPVVGITIGEFEQQVGCL